MIAIGTTEFYFAAPNFPRSRLEKYSLTLFDSWELSVERNLLLPDYSLSLEIEEGSISGKGKLAATLGAVYLSIAGYGSFISGLQTIRDQITTVSDVLAETAGKQVGIQHGYTKVKKRSEVLGSLQRLFVRVQRGEISPEQAIGEAEALIGADANESPAFMSSLMQSLIEAPRFHEQIPLPLDSLDDTIPGERPEKERRPRKPSAPSWPTPAHLRVEVWRESKKQKKNFRTTNV